MLLSEQFKKRIMQLAGLPAEEKIIAEADKRNIITQKLKIPKEVADWAHNLSDKYAVWIADSLRNLHIANHESWLSNKTSDEAIASMNDYKKVWSLKSLFDAETPYQKQVADAITTIAKTKTGDYQYILDWLKGRNTLAPEHDQINFKTLTFQEAKKRSEEWHEKLKEIQGGQIQDEDGEVIMNFQDGFYWIKIGKDYCPKEAQAMGHCGRASGTILYSLRKDQYPYVTAAVKEETGAVTQMKGRANTKPKAQFHKYIIPFILGNNPNVTYFKSTYDSKTDFNIADLSEAELIKVVDAKPSLLMWDGAIAIKKLSEEEIQKLLLRAPQVFEGSDALIFLSDILRTESVVDWAIAHAPQLFRAHNWGDVKFNKDQLYKALNTKVIADYLELDYIELDEAGLNWVVHNKPEMFAKSEKSISRLNDEQKNFLVKHYPEAFRHFLSLTDSNEDKKIFDILGQERLRALFINNPGLFAPSKISLALFRAFLTPELLEKYVKSHNIQNDPLKIINNSIRLDAISNFMNLNTALYFVKHYPTSANVSSVPAKANEEGWGSLGRYIVDNHFNWLTEYFSPHSNKRFNIDKWDLTPLQKQKIVDSEVKGDTNLLSKYNSEEIERMNFSPSQINELMNPEDTDSLTIDMIIGFKIAPEKAIEPLIHILDNNQDQNITIIKAITGNYGEEFIHQMYNTSPDSFEGLVFAVKFKDVNRLKKHNDMWITYQPDKVKIRYDDWQDSDLLDLYENENLAKRIANYDLDFSGYDYKFDEMTGDFDELNKLNIAKVKFLLTKAFPKEYKESIKGMSDRELASLLNDPESLSEEHIEYDEDIIDAIKDCFVRALEDSQRNADENEYWKLFTEPITELLGKSEWATIKTKTKGSDEITNKEMLEFEISYDKLVGIIESGEEYNNSADDSYSLTVDGEANDLKTIIKYSLDNNGKLEIEESRYGVNGDRTSELVNESFEDHLSNYSNLTALLAKSKVIKKKIDEPK